MKYRALILITVVLAATASAPASAYLKLGSQVGTRTLSLKWSSLPIRYYLTNRGAVNVTPQQLQQTVASAFASWDTVPTAKVSSEFAGFVASPPGGGDNLTVIGFQNHPELDRTLGATSFIIDTITGDIVESDIFFNSAFPWSVDPQGDPTAFDLQSIALHEIGHLHGLAHSALGETELRSGGRRVIAAEAVMFPIAFSPGSVAFRTPRADDIAGISDLYPSATFSRQTGSISGKVTKNGAGVFGAHVVAYDQRTGKLIAGFSLSNDGSFVIGGLDPGPHILRAEPLDDADIESFLDATRGVDVDFRVKFYEKVVVVPKGGGTSKIEIKVVSK